MSSGAAMLLSKVMDRRDAYGTAVALLISRFGTTTSPLTKDEYESIMISSGLMSGGGELTSMAKELIER